jgi:dTDP-4-dehydrorhamnose reductase
MTGRRVAVTGAGGRLGAELVRAFEAGGHEVLPLAHPAFDITRPTDLGRVTDWHPEVVVNSAAWTDVDGCARDPERAMRINGKAAGGVAAAAAAAGALSVQVSTNEVFDGTAERPYAEDDEPNPINSYGASKLAGENAVTAANPRHLVVRTAWLFGPLGPSFPSKIREAADRARASGEPLRVVEDEWGNPTWIPWLADSIVALVSGPSDTSGGTWHLAGDPPTSRLGWAEHVLRGSEVEILPTRLDDYARPSRPPKRAVLDTRRAGAAGLTLDWMSVNLG